MKRPANRKNMIVDASWLDFIDGTAPKFNMDITLGLSTTQSSRIFNELDFKLRAIAKSFPAGFEYNNISRCTPREEFMELAGMGKGGSPTKVIDIAESSIRMIKMHLRFKGEDLPPKYIYQAYFYPGNRFTLGGTKYNIRTVISDKVLSTNAKGVFFRGNRHKFMIAREQHPVIIDGQKHLIQVPWPPIYPSTKNNKTVAPTTRAKTACVHYLLGKYGLNGMFKEFVGCDVVLGRSEINVETYPSSDWVIVESLRIKPKTFIGDYYRPTDLRLAVPRAYWDQFSAAFAAGLFYVIDNFPEKIDLKEVNGINMWRILLGNIIFSGSYGQVKLLSSVTEHYSSLDHYVDDIVLEKLRMEFGREFADYLKVDGLYRLLAVVTKNFNNWVAESQESAVSLFDKSFEFFYYVMYPIITNMNLMNFKLNAQGATREITLNDINTQLKQQVTKGAVLSLRKDALAVQVLNYPGDSIYFGCTYYMSQQLIASGANRGSGSSREINGAALWPHESHAAVGSHFNLSRTRLNGGSVLNPFVYTVGENHTAVMRPEHVKILTELRDSIKPRPSTEEFTMDADPEFLSEFDEELELPDVE